MAKTNDMLIPNEDRLLGHRAIRKHKPDFPRCVQARPLQGGSNSRRGQGILVRKGGARQMKIDTCIRVHRAMQPTEMGLNELTNVHARDDAMGV